MALLKDNFLPELPQYNVAPHVLATQVWWLMFVILIWSLRVFRVPQPLWAYVARPPHVAVAAPASLGLRVAVARHVCLEGKWLPLQLTT